MSKDYKALEKEKEIIINEASKKQRLAADPRYSIWVSASAGTGKTRILTNRVLRLLLDDVLPHRILCLTFTNAAAAEMNDRVQESLAEWMHMDDNALCQSLENLLGSAPSEALKQKAKSLFAKTLESPIGLRIQTIHGFCQQILSRFPVEAHIPPNFSIIDSMQSEELLKQAIDDTITQLLKEKDLTTKSSLAQAFDTLLAENSEHGLTQLLDATRYYRHEIISSNSAHDDAQTEAIYRQFLQIPAHMNLEQLKADFLNQLQQRLRQIKDLTEAFRQYGGKNEAKYVAILDEFLAHPDKQIQNIESYKSIFLTQKNEIKSSKGFPTKDVAAGLPKARDYIEAEQEVLLKFLETEAALTALKHSLALLKFSGTVLKKWQDTKLSHMLLDYDDLIERTSLLLKDNMSWVHYKLDEGIDHILLDEAQDTSPKQWKIIEHLSREFFMDLEQDNHKNRTLFVVGDFKQSIYSFQGARPEAFFIYQNRFMKMAQDAQKPFENIELDTNFRSTSPILQFTDNVINISAKQGVLQHNEDSLIHRPVRMTDSGNVEIWPLLDAQEKETFEFSFPPDLASQSDNTDKIAKNIARRIRQLLDEKFYISSKNRSCKPQDFLILVRKRHPLVAPLIKALNAHNIPVFGADRIDILEQIAVQDLLALARFMLQPLDDYSLACILRSPLFDISEDDLFELSFERDASLFQQLKAKQNDKLCYKQAYDILSHWQSFVDYQSPFAFFSHILAEKQYERMILRLSGEAKDALYEFLEFCQTWEKRHPPLLETFMRIVDSGELNIKREFENNEEFEAVRIMTIHGSKGLQAPIIILPECQTYRSKPQSQYVQLHQDGEHHILLYTKAALPEAMQLEKEDKAHEDEKESRRLLYVALTRAEDKLIIGGSYRSKKEQKTGLQLAEPKTWYEYMLKAVSAGDCNFTELHNNILDFEEPILCFDYKGSTAIVASEPEAKIQTTRLPDYFRQNAPTENRPYNPLSPGQIMEDDEIAARSPLDNINLGRLFNRGLIIHKLLELLPQSDKKDWHMIAQHYLSQKNWQLSPSQQKQVEQEIMTVLNHPDFTEVFHPDALVEVPISGIIDDNIVSGRIDRLLIKDDEILLIDFKTNRKPPQKVEDIPSIYIKQLNIYKKLLSDIWPNKPIKSALLWTDSCQLMVL
ncbi:MAG: double-strand break repair helicase AddA [Alphaproteobacteria bacterium]